MIRKFGLFAGAALLFAEPVYECPHLNQALYLRLFGICAVQNVLVKL